MATHLDTRLPIHAGSPRSGGQALGYVNEPGYDDPDGASNLLDPEGNGFCVA